MRLLLIEDDPTLQTTLQRSLTRKAMTVELCGDGRQALARWRQVQPDVVLLDLSLPGLDGLEVLAQARRGGLDTPVLILTARGTVGDRIVGLNTGADDYLAKPFDLGESFVVRTAPINDKVGYVYTLFCLRLVKDTALNSCLVIRLKELSCRFTHIHPQSTPMS